MTLLTLSQNVELFKQFAYLHLNLGRNVSNEHFFFGDSWELGASVPPKYPLMQVGLVSDSTNLQTFTRTFRIEFTDLVKKDESNELYVQSDMNLLALDFLLYMETIKDSNDLGLMISDNITLNPFTEKHDDEVTGYGFEFSVTGHIGSLSCALPIVPGNYFENNYIFIGGSNAGDFIVEIKDQDGNILQTFTTSGSYTVEVLQQIIDTINSNTSTIIDPIN